ALVPTVAQTPPAGPCGPTEEAGFFCRTVYELTGNSVLARASELLVGRPLKILLIVAVTWLATRLLRRAIGRLAGSLRHVNADVTGDGRSAGTLLRTDTVLTPRAAQRTETIAVLLSSVAGFVAWTIAGFMIFGELGVEIGPLLAGAGIVGVALGFGAQNLVRDFLSGIFMLIEDQYGVGDVIDAGPATGVVEGISLRTTRLRDVEGVVWHIPNGTIERVGNKSQEWSRALIDVQVAYRTDVDHATTVIKRIADATAQDPDREGEILGEPEVWGVEALGADGISIRLVVKTKPLSQWSVARELRARIKQAFDDEGIEIPFPQRVVWYRGAHEEQGLHPAGDHRS
ncbi:MAG: mechanosensitive ion channel family protein, partial [Actinomycetota bacterium]